MPPETPAPRATAHANPSPSLHGLARSSRPRSRAKRPANPPVARIRASGNTWPSRTSPAARTSASVSPAVSKRQPTVRGFPVSRSSTGAPRASSQASASSSPSTTRACRAGSPAGHSARNSSSERCRQTTPLDSSIEPPARSPFSWTTASTPSSRARAAATRPARPAPATSSRVRRARRRACARRTRASPGRAPRRRLPGCSARRRRRRSRCRAPRPRRCAPRPSRRGRRRG